MTANVRLAAALTAAALIVPIIRTYLTPETPE